MPITRTMIEKRFHPSQEPPSWLKGMGGWNTTSGITVTPDTALQNMTVLACVRFIAETLGSLPHVTFQKTTRGRDRATKHYLYDILHDVPNPEMTAMTYHETVTGHVALRGNGLSEIELDNAGRVRALWPLNPDRIQRMERRKGMLFYIITLPASVGGQEVGLPADRVMHVRWFGTNGLWSPSPVMLAKNSIGMSLAAQQYIAQFFSNNAEPGVVLTTEKELSDKAYDRLQKDWEARHQGLDKSHRIAILEEGLSIEKLGVNNKESELLQVLDFGSAEIARLYNLSLDMLAIAGASATYASVEEFGERLKTYTIRPWAIRWNQEANRSLLTEEERKGQGYYTEIILDALLSASIEKRYTAFVQGIQNGFLSPNEVREKENMNTYEGGSVYLAPMNLSPIDELSQANTAGGKRYLGGEDMPRIETRAASQVMNIGEDRAQRSVGQRRRLMISQGKVIRDVAARVLRREFREILDAAKKAFGKRDAQSMDMWLSQFYHGHQEFVRKQFLPVMTAYAELVAGVASDEVNSEETAFRDEIERFARSYTASYASRHVGIDQANVGEMIRAAWDQEDPATTLERSLESYQESRADEIARWESNRENNAAARLVYVMAGMKNIRWNSKDNCTYCTSLDKKVINVDEYYLRTGDEYQPEGADKSFSVKHDMGHPPLCNGCECLISAER